MGEDKRIIVKKKLKLDYEKESYCFLLSSHGLLIIYWLVCKLLEGDPLVERKKCLRVTIPSQFTDQ